MAKKLIRLTESDLHKVITESVNRIIKEYTEKDTDIRGKNVFAVYKKGTSPTNKNQTKVLIKGGLNWSQAQNLCNKHNGDNNWKYWVGKAESAG